MAAAAQAEAARMQAMIGTVSSTITADGSASGGNGSGSAPAQITQNNNFAEMDPEVAVVAAGQALAGVARRAGT